MTKKNIPDAGDDSASIPPAFGDATERHLVKARELLREARSRLSSRSDGTPDATQNVPTSSDEPE